LRSASEQEYMDIARLEPASPKGVTI
jgi:hypothetical protein